MEGQSRGKYIPEMGAPPESTAQGFKFSLNGIILLHRAYFRSSKSVLAHEFATQ